MVGIWRKLVPALILRFFFFFFLLIKKCFQFFLLFCFILSFLSISFHQSMNQRTMNDYARPSAQLQLRKSHERNIYVLKKEEKFDIKGIVWLSDEQQKVIYTNTYQWRQYEWMNRNIATSYIFCDKNILCIHKR